MDKLKIVPFNTDYISAFEKLNREWIEEYFIMEEEDLMTLQNPESYVMERGGEIFFAVLDGDVVGTAALIKKVRVFSSWQKWPLQKTCGDSV